MESISDQIQKRSNERQIFGDNLAASPLENLLELAELKHYKMGHVLFNSGNIPRGIHIIKNGKVKVSMYGVDGKEQIINILKNGDVIGYHSILFDRRIHDNSEVLEDANIWYVSRDDFNSVVKNNCEMTNYFVQLLCNDLEKLEKRLVSIAYEPVRGRLASLLLELAEIYKNDTGTSINLSRSDLANMAGTAKETAIRLLSEFKAEKLITTNGTKINVINNEGLKKVGDMYH